MLYLSVHTLLTPRSPYNEHSKVEAVGNKENSAETENKLIFFKHGGGLFAEHLQTEFVLNEE